VVVGEVREFVKRLFVVNDVVESNELNLLAKARSTRREISN